MSLRVLELDDLRLTSVQDKLQLSIRTFATFQVPTTISLFDDGEIVKALTSGHIWVSRGAGFRLDIRVSTDGKLIDRSTSLHLLEGIGYTLRDAPLWDQLHLLPVLQFCPPDNPAEQTPHFSIHISHGMQPSAPNIESKAWLQDHTDVNPPGSVQCAQFARLRIHFEFLTIKDKPSPGAKRTESTANDSSSRDVMLLDYPVGLVKGHLEESEEVAAVLSQRLSDSVSKCFEVTNFTVKSESLNGTTEFPRQQRPPQAANAEILDPGVQEAPRNVPPRSAKDKKDILRKVELHHNNPYPTKDERNALMKETGYARASVNKCLKTLRQRLESCMTQPGEHELLALQAEVSADQCREMGGQYADEMLIDQESDVFNDDDMLLSQLDDCQSSLTSISSITSIMCTDSQCIPPKRHHTLAKPIPSQSPAIAEAPACKLSEVALRFLIGGIQHRLGGIKITTPDPEASLSLLAPVIFCPGFKQSMANNARFLHTISTAVCGSLVRNAQGAGLRNKLVLLAKCTPLVEDQGCAGEYGLQRNLAAVVQSRLWEMMQRKLYDSAASSKLSYRVVVDGIARFADPEGEDDDILAELDRSDVLADEGLGLGDAAVFMDDESMGEEADGFSDLCAGEDDDGLLDYLEDIEIERERLEVERVTDEMLFESGKDADEGEEGRDEMLLMGEGLSESEGDSMLL